jgi:hypothetical protein
MATHGFVQNVDVTRIWGDGAHGGRGVDADQRGAAIVVNLTTFLLALSTGEQSHRGSDRNEIW